MFQWLKGPGAAFKSPLPGSTNYMGAYNRESGRLERRKASHGQDELPPEGPEDLMPFRMNRKFKSQAVLSEELKEEIWRRVVVHGKSVQTVSTELQVEMRRVGAVVRLKTIEKQWAEQGKPLATAYASAILGMLPKTRFTGGAYQRTHESINDLPVHRATLTQIFHPVSESRHFTRRDAGKVFDRGLLPPEDRIPHPQLVELAALRLTGTSFQESKDIIKQKMQEKEEQRTASRKAWQEREKSLVKKVLPGGKDARCEFRFRDISVELAGKDGRGPSGIGMRYGLPPQDRKKGQIKIPTKVEL